jgi:hypothetical protein
MTQEIQSMKSRSGPSGIYRVTARHIEGTQMCEIQLPCKYKDKNLVVLVYEDNG